jgi:phosphotransferase system, enzyme I, PtsP
VCAAALHDVPVTVCGEMGGRPLEALALIALGVERLSITPAGIGPIKAMIRSATLEPLSDAMLDWLAQPGVNIREQLSNAAKRQGLRF